MANRLQGSGRFHPSIGANVTAEQDGYHEAYSRNKPMGTDELSPVVRSGGSIWAAGVALGIRYPLSAGAWVIGISASAATLGRYFREDTLDSQALLMAVGGIAIGAFLWPSRGDRERYRSEHSSSKREAWWLVPAMTAIVGSLLIFLGSLSFLLWTANRDLNGDLQRSEDRISDLESQIAETESTLFTAFCLMMTDGNNAECERALEEYERTR